MTQPLRIGTRGSRLALAQANMVADMVRPIVAPREVELIEIHTTGDQSGDVSLQIIGGQGVFTKEIQQAVLDGRADVAVHSLKDLPTTAVAGLVLAAVPKRGPTGDVFISHKHGRFDELPQGARIATGSNRRRAQLLHRRPDLQLVDIRGNVDTRLRKMRDQDLDGIILAQAGLERLGLQDEAREVFDPSWMLPAVGQGALGLECREDDVQTREVLEELNDGKSMAAVLAERSFLRTLGGGCLLPIGARAIIEDDHLVLAGAVLSTDGRERLTEQETGQPAQADALGVRLADRLLHLGAAELLKK